MNILVKLPKVLVSKSRVINTVIHTYCVAQKCCCCYTILVILIFVYFFIIAIILSVQKVPILYRDLPYGQSYFVSQ